MPTSDRRRLLQFRLRTLLVAVLALSLPLSWVAVNLQRARKQGLAVQSLRSLGAEVIYYDADVGRNAPPFSLRGLLGDDFFCNVGCVIFDAESGENPRLELLRDLPHLSQVELMFTRVADPDLQQLQCLKDVQHLDLRFCAITDSGLEHLHSLTSLRCVELDFSHVTDQGVRRLQQALPNCLVAWSQSSPPGSLHHEQEAELLPPAR